MTAAKVESIAKQEAEKLERLDIADLRIANWNARKTFDEARIAELKSSIEAHGIQVPLIVRPTSGPAYEIVAGHRRFRAALALCEKGNLKFEYLPCIVRQLTDDEAREIGLVDNVQREDVPPLEQAAAYQELKHRLGTPAAIAARVGKPVADVTRSLKLLDLGEMPRKALAERLITIDHALLLARLGEEEQNVNLKWALNPNSGIKEPVEETIKQRIQERDRKEVRYSGYWEPQSVLDLKHHIEQNVGRKLSRAPWDLDDATLLQDVPACNNCPSNTKHNESLFGDLNIDAATCEDGLCFIAKRTAFVQIKLAAAGQNLSAKPPKRIARLSWKFSTARPKTGFNDDLHQLGQNTCADVSKVINAGAWIEAKKGSCPNVRPGVTVDWSDDGNRGYMGTASAKKTRKPGETLLVCIACGCKVHRKEYEKPKSENRNAPYDAKAEEAKREKLRVDAVAESKIRANVAFKAIEAVKSIPAEALRKLVLEQIPNWGDKAKTANALLPGLAKIVQTAKVDSVQFAKALAVVSISANLCAWEHSAATDGRSDFLAAIKRIGYDGSNAWKELANPAAKKQPPAKKAAKKKGGRR